MSDDNAWTARDIVSDEVKTGASSITIPAGDYSIRTSAAIEVVAPKGASISVWRIADVNTTRRMSDSQFFIWMALVVGIMLMASAAFLWLTDWLTLPH